MNMYRWLFAASMAAGWVMTVGCGGDEGAVETAQRAAKGPLTVDFSGCSEMAGIGWVPAAGARALVPADIALAGDDTSAIVVVRVASCAGLVVDGKARGGGTVAQIGVSMAGGDPTSDINNYTLWYLTDSGQLSGQLHAAGIDVRHEQHLGYALAAGALTVTSPRDPPLVAQGPVVEPTAAPVPFIASWWQVSHGRTIQMRTVLPAIAFSSAQMVVETPAGSDLAALFGGTTQTFALLDSFNRFDAASMVVSSP